jgi:hypothetical protein
VKSRYRALASFALFAVAVVMVMGFSLSASAQTASNQSSGWVDDWTHHRVVFSNPGSYTDALKNGTAERWQRITSSPRYQLQQLKRSSTARALAAAPDFAARMAVLNAVNADPAAKRPKPPGNNPVKKDWNTPLGSGATASQTGTFTGAAGSSQYAKITVGSNVLQLNTASGTTNYGTVTVSTSSVSGDTIAIGSITYTWVTTLTSTANEILVTTGSGSTGHDDNAANLAAAINANPSLCASGQNPCFSAGTVANTAAYATVSSAVVTVYNNTTTKLTGNSGNSQWYSSKTSDFGLNPTTGTGITASGAANACTGSTSGTFVYSTGLSASLQAANLAAAINACENTYSAVGVTATSSSGTVTVTAASSGAAGNTIALATTLGNFSWTGSATKLAGGTTATVQPNAYPAFWGASLTAESCANDFVVFPTGQAGASGAANIIAYYELYTGGTGCSTVPSVYWAYNTENGLTGYSVTTSPVLSVDGKKVAFIQSNGTSAYLVVVKPPTSLPDGSLGSPKTPAVVTNITSSCSTACMTITKLTNDVTYSAPYYDYLSDAVYVGDDGGSLEKFTGVFNGAISGPTTFALGNTYALAPPVYDDVSGYVFVGDTYGYLYKVNSGLSTVVTSAFLSKDSSSNQGTEGIFDAPLLDNTKEQVYAFVTDSATVGSCTAGNNCIAEYAVSFTGGASPSVAEPLGTGGAGYNLYAGTFDNIWWVNTTASTGNLYVIGNTGSTSGATLYQVPISGGTIGGPNQAVTALTTTQYPWPSPVEEFCDGACTIATGSAACGSSGVTCTNPGNDYVFFSVNDNNKSCTGGSGSGCIFSYNVSIPTPTTKIAEGGGLNVTTPSGGCWATGAIVIDNMASSGGSQIYFVGLNGATAGGGANGATAASSNCAVGTGPTLNATQASQAAP